MSDLKDDHGCLLPRDSGSKLLLPATAENRGTSKVLVWCKNLGLGGDALSATKLFKNKIKHKPPQQSLPTVER